MDDVHKKQKQKFDGLFFFFLGGGGWGIVFETSHLFGICRIVGTLDYEGS